MIALKSSCDGGFPPKVALEGRLRHCRQVVTLGVLPNFSDYSPEDRELIRRADKIYYPSAFYAELFDTLGKKTFPSYHTYKFAQDKIKQTALFDIAGIPHPRTRTFYGRQNASILNHFSLPVIAKVPRGSALGHGVTLIRTADELRRYCQSTTAAYIQEYLPIDRDIRVVVIGKKAAHAYWRIARKDEYRTNLAQGGRIELSPVPQSAVALAERVASTCGFDDVGMDICQHENKFYILEANMKYGREGFIKAGIDYTKLLEQKIANGEI